ncbi:MAG: response regulator [Elusimicrobia bacterium]|nr:response regulator [Elusimicrobiota bacterium]
MQKTILVIDDEPGYLDLLAFELSRRGFFVLTAPNGLEALDILEKERPDLIITDMRMPVMDGLDTVISIREKHADLPIILVTGFSTEERVQRVLAYQATSYLKKPFELEMLMEAIQKHLSLS